MKRRLPSRCQAGCPTETSSPHSTVHGRPAATKRVAPVGGRPRPPAASPPSPSDPTACRGGPTRPWPTVGPSYRAGVHRRSRVLRPGSTPRRSPGGRRGRRCSAEGRASSSRPVLARRRPARMDLPHRHHPVPVRAGPEPPVRPALAGRRRTGERDRSLVPSSIQPHALVAAVHVGERSRARARGRGNSLPRRTRAPGSGCSRPAASCPPRRPGRLRLRPRADPQSVGAHEHHATALRRARLEPVHRASVGGDFRERHLAGGGLRRAQRRGPMPVRDDRVHERRT